MSESSALRAAAEIIREHRMSIASGTGDVICKGCDWRFTFVGKGYAEPYDACIAAHAEHLAGLVAAALLPEEPPEWWRDAVEEAVHGYNEPARAYQALRATLLKGTP